MKQTKHQKIIDDLEQRLNKNNYDNIFKNLVFGETRDLGEIDLFAVRHNYFLFFEIKTNHSEKRYKKAIEQLVKIKDRFTSYKTRNWFFYVYGTNEGYEIKQIKI